MREAVKVGLDKGKRTLFPLDTKQKEQNGMKIEERQKKTTTLDGLCIGEVFRLLAVNNCEADEGLNLRRGHIFIVLWDGIADLSDNFYFDDKELTPTDTIVSRINAKLIIED